jgi:hypothetical protein
MKKKTNEKQRTNASKILLFSVLDFTLVPNLLDISNAYINPIVKIRTKIFSPRRLLKR